MSIKRYLWYLILILILLLSTYYVNVPKTTYDPLLKADHIRVEKEMRRLYLFRNGICIKQYSIALGSSPAGHKEKEGDGKTPEGNYYIVSKNPKSNYCLSLLISYPSDKDVKAAKLKNVNAGGAIMIHGIRNGLGWIGKNHTLMDWTRGCIAVTNEEIQEIYNAVQPGTTVEILP